MLETEAQWVGQIVTRLPVGNISPLLNVGSATAQFRERDQPWIHHHIFAPLLQSGVEVHHLDMQAGEGIDLSGDLTDETFVNDVTDRGYRALLCCNVLEHVADPASLCAKLERVVSGGGYLIVTVPKRFPYHPDPIDTLFRPELEELVGLFPNCRLLCGAVVDCGTGWDYVDRDPRVLIAKVRRRLAGMQEHGGVRGTSSFLPWLFRRFRQTCAVLQTQIGTI